MCLDDDLSAVEQPQAHYGADARAVEQGLSGSALQLAAAELIQGTHDVPSVVRAVDCEFYVSNLPLGEVCSDRRKNSLIHVPQFASLDTGFPIPFAKSISGLPAPRNPAPAARATAAAACCTRTFATFPSA